MNVTRQWRIIPALWVLALCFLYVCDIFLTPRIVERIQSFPYIGPGLTIVSYLAISATVYSLVYDTLAAFLRDHPRVTMAWILLWACVLVLLIRSGPSLRSLPLSLPLPLVVVGLLIGLNGRMVVLATNRWRSAQWGYRLMSSLAVLLTLLWAVVACASYLVA